MSTTGRHFWQGLTAKSLLVLGATTLPALVVAALLGGSLISMVTDVRREFDEATDASRRLTEIRVLAEREHGLVARLPAELDQQKVSHYAAEVAELQRSIDRKIRALADNTTIMVHDTYEQLRETRRDMKRDANAVIEAARSFAQTTALEIVDRSSERDYAVLTTLLDAVASSADDLAERSRSRLEASARTAWRLMPVALLGVAFGMVFGFWLLRRHLVRPVTVLTDYVLQIRATGSLDRAPDLPVPARRDEIGMLSQSFDLMVRELAEARRRLPAH